jgi:gentisate 1,2-dioxygenase
VPLWHYHRHETNHDASAILFALNDQPLRKALGFYREQSRP